MRTGSESVSNMLVTTVVGADASASNVASDFGAVRGGEFCDVVVESWVTFTGMLGERRTFGFRFFLRVTSFFDTGGIHGCFALGGFDFLGLQIDSSCLADSFRLAQYL